MSEDITINQFLEHLRINLHIELNRAESFDLHLLAHHLRLAKSEIDDIQHGSAQRQHELLTDFAKTINLRDETENKLDVIRKSLFDEFGCKV